MPRRGNVFRKDMAPDPVYNSKTVAKLINQIMLKGKKSISEGICYGAFEIIQQKAGKSPLSVFESAMKNVMPILEVKARRVGGANYQVPIEVRPERRQTLAIRWITKYARERSGKRHGRKTGSGNNGCCK